MAGFSLNFSCSGPELSRVSVTEKAWMIVSEGPSHTNSITTIGVTQILFMIIGIPWNSVVLLSILKKRLYSEPTYILLLNLVVADLLVCVCVMPFNAASALTKHFTIGNSDYARCQVCHTIIIIIISLVFVSLFTLALMSVDRLIYIKWPLHYSRIVRVKGILVILVAVWIVSTVVNFFPIFGVGEIKYSNYVGSCSPTTVGKTHLTKNINYMVILVIVALFPFMTTLIANIWLLVLVCKTVHAGHHKNLDNSISRFSSIAERKNSEQTLKVKYQKQQVHLARVFGAIFAVNIITWIPTVFISLVSASIGAENVPPPAFAFMFLAFLSQPVIHPILETCLVGKARSVVMKCLCCCKREKRDVKSNSTVSLTSTRRISHSSSIPSSP